MKPTTPRPLARARHRRLHIPDIPCKQFKILPLILGSLATVVRFAQPGLCEWADGRRIRSTYRKAEPSGSASIEREVADSLNGAVNANSPDTATWDRRFEARISLLQAAPELRPGMTSNLVITVETLDNVLWIPAQALFESDGRTFVYARGPTGFVPHDVALVRRSESQTVITGIREGEIVAMSNPDQQLKSGATQSGSAMKALSQ